MCGICGWIGHSRIDPSILDRMTGALAHRGPDHQDTYVRGNVGLGHTRLSILDLSPLGNQPMHSADGSVSITYNGEFYDFEKYRNELISQGQTFRSHCDTEVIIHLYLRYGISFVEKLRGMFALAIWDHRSQELFLIRDRVGKKPLYYCCDANGFAFASELKALICHPDVSRSIDPYALDTYFRLGYVPKSDSIFSSVRKLEAGHYLRYKDGRIEVTQYWNIPPAEETRGNMSWDEASETLSQLLRESVALRLVSDVPVGMLLSGGTDSSLVATLAAEQSAEPLKTFSIGFDEEQFNELPYARQIASHIGSEHYEHVVKLDETELIADLAPYFDEPFADPSLLPTYLVSKMARQHVKVALSGDGGDEL
ncbi:MAG: asparagine synthase (glutamine-hydrolyzing), partial [Woeseiaceae bacterium]